MEDLIKMSYGLDEEAKKCIEEGNYQLYLETKSMATILPNCWDILVEPGWKVVIRLNLDRQSSTDSDDGVKTDGDEPEQESENLPTVYTTKFKYTIEYFAKEDKFRGKLFLYSLSHDDNVMLGTSDNKSRELPVLEEKRPVTFGNFRNEVHMYGPPRKGESDNYQAESRQKREPTLDVGDVVGKKSLLIRSPLLLNALRSVIKYSSQSLSGDEGDQLKSGSFLHPYSDLFYHKQELHEYKKQTTGTRANHTPEYNAECDRHIDLLL